MGSASGGPTPLAAGDLVAGKFLVERTLRTGSSGHVVEARHRELGTRVAIKVSHRTAAAEPESAAAFLRGGRAMARLTSDHVVRVYDVGETDSGLPFVIMEYLEGQDLGSVLVAEGPLEIEAALRHVAQACDGLAEAHEAGLVHGELRPQSLFLTRRSSGESHVRILDFGLGTDDPEGASPYRAPEQVRGDVIDARTDVWGAGVCLFRLLTGQLPFGGDPAATSARILGEPPVRIRDLRPEIPSAVERVVARCLAKDRDDRFADMRQLATTLRAARKASTGSLGRIVAHGPISSTPSVVAELSADVSSSRAPGDLGPESFPSGVALAAAPRSRPATRGGDRRLLLPVLLALFALALLTTVAVVVARKGDAPRAVPAQGSAR